MNNIYITEATTDDIQNDQWILLEIRGKITDAIHHAQKLQKKGAMAYNPDFLTKTIDALDNITADIITPLQDKLDDAEAEHRVIHERRVSD
ncbi:hypothetical protein [Marinobacter sp.]|jgi:hypothetical protein|uniref:hypothetical protein n=1 Tax=Marinobacter sp. TaxID=50741 RepID=UPI000C903381|nr:hypothetical protein [Marinobacter sp.]MAK49767.1 hypothetical protein [Marinobacter sp.]MAK50904.1 hypothetical protein [Marinobacter sp.]MAK51607.1 hypothetical protein [Marinobacter sp.]|tara:strand:+ start:506 stop:778 length:273 start_codon:yes stop_codon:yes gene_type:complete